MRGLNKAPSLVRCLAVSMHAERVPLPTQEWQAPPLSDWPLRAALAPPQLPPCPPQSPRPPPGLTRPRARQQQQAAEEDGGHALQLGTCR